MESTQRSSGRRPHKVRCAQDAQVWASLAALPCSSSPNHDHYVGSWLGSRGAAPYDFRTRGARLENGLNLFGAGMNLGPLCLPPAAARAGQIRRSFFSHIAPLVCLAFSTLFGRGRPMWRPVRRARRPGAPSSQQRPLIRSSSQATHAPGQSLLPLRGNSPSHSFPPKRQKLTRSAARPLPNVTAYAGSRWGPRMATFPPTGGKALRAAKGRPYGGVGVKPPHI